MPQWLLGLWPRGLLLGELAGLGTRRLVLSVAGAEPGHGEPAAPVARGPQWLQPQGASKVAATE